MEHLAYNEVYRAWKNIPGRPNSFWIQFNVENLHILFGPKKPFCSVIRVQHSSITKRGQPKKLESKYISCENSMIYKRNDFYSYTCQRHFWNVLWRKYVNHQGKFWCCPFGSNLSPSAFEAEATVMSLQNNQRTGILKN